MTSENISGSEILQHRFPEELRQLGKVARAAIGGDRGRQRSERRRRERHRHAGERARRHRRHQILAQRANVERHLGRRAFEHIDFAFQPTAGIGRLLQHVEHLIEREALLDRQAQAIPPPPEHSHRARD